ncbi:MAG: chemotaxis-specific methylesterase [Verrucomicrobiota bacterium]|jgi:two-component system response regulator WspF
MRIGIVNDLSIAAEAQRRIIQGGSDHEVIWSVRSGEEAINRCLKELPDAILMDLVMPGMDGVEATRHIMATTPCIIIIVSSNLRDQSAQVFEAMGAGALDVVDAPMMNGSGAGDSAKLFLRKLEQISKLVSRADSTGKIIDDKRGNRSRLVAIGASAGGPAALATVLTTLPKNFNAAVVIIQHVDPQFSGGLAAWLNHHSHLPVRLAEEGDRPRPGEVLVAAREEHLVFTSPNRLGYTRVPVETSYRPSVDVFLKSVAHYWKGEVIGVLLTGMGRDGAEGLRVLRDSGHRTIAQDRRTSAVFGMPKAAADLNAASEILALDKIGPRLANIFPAG